MGFWDTLRSNIANAGVSSMNRLAKQAARQVSNSDQGRSGQGSNNNNGDQNAGNLNTWGPAAVSTSQSTNGEQGQGQQQEPPKAAEDEKEDENNDISHYQQALMNGGYDDYVADLNAIAMPTGEQMQQLTPEQQRQWAADRGSEFADLMLTLATLPIGGIGAGAVKGASVAGRAARAGEKAAQTAIKSSESAMKLGGKEAAKIAELESKLGPGAVEAAEYGNKIAKEAGLPTNSRTYWNALTNAGKTLNAEKTASEELAEDILPKLIPGTTLGMGGLGSALMAEMKSNQTGNNGIGSGGDGGDGGNGSNGGGNSTTTSGGDAGISDEDFQKLWGLSEADYNKLEQGDQFRKALENSDLGEYYKDHYGIGGDMAYEQWRDIGQTNDYDDKREIVRDVLGLGEDPSKAIPGWLELYGNSGINIDRGKNNERDEQIIQDVMDYMWGADNIINPYLWAENENNYAAAHSLGGEGTAARLGEYFADNYYPNYGENYFQQFKNPETGESLFPKLDNKDFGIIAMAQNLANKDLSQYGEDNIDQIAAILNGAGDNASFNFLNDGEEGGINRASQSQYNLRDLLDATSNRALPYDVYGAQGEPGVNSPIWSKVADDIMADIAKSTRKGIKRN